MNTNLTPSEIAEITRKANLLFPESPQAYIAAKLEDAAEIKRLREGIEKLQDGIKEDLKWLADKSDDPIVKITYGMSSTICDVRFDNLKQLLNNQS